jgi:WD40 repeat protein
VKLWDSQTGNELRTLQGRATHRYCLTFSPDGKNFASGAADGSLTVWDTETGEELYSLPGHAAIVHSVAFSPDGRRLASASYDKTVKVREAKAIPEARPIGRGHVADLVFSQGGKRLASIHSPSYDKIHVWDTQTGEQLSSIDTGNPPFGQGSRPGIQTSSFSADGTRAATAINLASLPQAPRVQANVWDLLTGKKVIAIPVSYPGTLVLSPDGKRLAAARRNWEGSEQAFIGAKITVWDAQTGAELHSIPNAGWPAVFTPDGQRLAGAASDKSVKIWDLQTGAAVRSFQGTAGCLAVSPDGKRLAGSTEDGTVAKVWDIQSSDELLTLRGHSGIINRLAFSPDGKRLASTARDAALKIWDSQTGQELLTLAGDTSAFNGLAFTQGGHWLACGGTATINIYDATPVPEKP